MRNVETDGLVARIHALLDSAKGTAAPRVIIGIVGAPGSGKSTVARRLVAALTRAGLPAVQVPMDGFHLNDTSLDELVLLDRKGSIETFDAHGYLALLHRLLREHDHDVYAPAFERTLEQPIAGAIRISPEHRVIVSEGNYLLDASAPWDAIRMLFGEVWFADLDDDRRRARLVDRHVRYGKTREEAQAWVDAVDEPNARRVIARRDAADLIITSP